MYGRSISSHISQELKVPSEGQRVRTPHQPPSPRPSPTVVGLLPLYTQGGTTLKLMLKPSKLEACPYALRAMTLLIVLRTCNLVSIVIDVTEAGSSPPFKFYLIITSPVRRYNDSCVREYPSTLRTRGERTFAIVYPKCVGF